jgi:teichuronic acid biosynthesis glycosyltransferase TuaG
MEVLVEQATTWSTEPVRFDEPKAKEVSVICTAKNAAATIKATISSILAQDFQNWEMIIVDDGSTDDTVAIIRNFAEADSRISVIATEGVGRGRALNRALAGAEAELVANLDADDESHPSRLRCQLEAMKRHPEFPLMFTGSVMVYGTVPPIWPEVDTNTPVAVADVTQSLVWCNPVVHSSAMMRKSVILGVGGYEEARPFVLDYDLWVRCAASGLRLGRIQLPLVAKRIHPGQWYLHSSRWRYLCAGVGIQIRAVRVLGLSPSFLPLIAARSLWVILPLWLRLHLRRLASPRSSRL